MTNKALSYKDVVLVPRYSEIISREDVNTSVNLGNWRFKSPIIPANMKCCIDIEKAKELGYSGYFIIIFIFFTDFCPIKKFLRLFVKCRTKEVFQFLLALE